MHLSTGAALSPQQRHEFNIPEFPVELLLLVQIAYAVLTPRMHRGQMAAQICLTPAAMLCDHSILNAVIEISN